MQSTLTALLPVSNIDDPEWYWMVCLPLQPLYIAAVPITLRLADILGPRPEAIDPRLRVGLTCFLRWQSEEAAIDAMAANQKQFGKNYGLLRLTPAQQDYAIRYGRQRKYALVSNSDGKTANVQLLSNLRQYTGQASGKSPGGPL